MTDITQLSLAEFVQLPTPQVAEMIKGLTLGFPIDGTRRWFLLHLPPVWNVEEYKALTAKRYVETFALLFDHGVETLLIPAFGGELMSRGEEYVREMMEGLARLAEHSTFVDFYRDYNVRVRFYGDWRRQVNGLPGADALTAALDNCAATHYAGPRRILYGLWADDMLVNIVDDLARSQREPVEFTREAIVTRYYGEYVKPTDIYIGFGRPTVFDVPMLVTSQTDLYYTVVPSLDLDARLFRMIVWDHFVGRWTQQEWDHVTEADLEALRSFYTAHHDHVLGLGEVDAATGVWYPQGFTPIDAFRKEHQEQ
jgi:tuberculosinol/isotuberculosinol synthase